MSFGRRLLRVAHAFPPTHCPKYGLLPLLLGKYLKSWWSQKEKSNANLMSYQSLNYALTNVRCKLHLYFSPSCLLRWMHCITGLLKLILI